MKYKILIFLFCYSCAGVNQTSIKSSFQTKGFAYIYNEDDRLQKITNKKFDNMKLSVSHNSIKAGSLLKITNPNNKKSIILKIKKTSRYPDLYKVLITEAVADHLSLDKNIPFVDIQEIIKNKSFIADKAKTFNEEKKVHNKAPITNVKIDNISKIEIKQKKTVKKFSILIGEFSTIESAIYLRNKLDKEILLSNHKLLKVNKKSEKSYQLLFGPFISVNSLKNGYIKLHKFGFEDLDFKTYE